MTALNIQKRKIFKRRRDGQIAQGDSVVSSASSFSGGDDLGGNYWSKIEVPNLDKISIDENGNLTVVADLTAVDAKMQKINGISVSKHATEQTLIFDGNIVATGGIMAYGDYTGGVGSIFDNLPDASTSSKGVAQFSPSYFSVAAGVVSILPGAVVAAETDPTVPTHVKNITTTQVSNWDAAYSNMWNTQRFDTSNVLNGTLRQFLSTEANGLSGYYVQYESAGVRYKLRAGYADSAGSVDWGNIANKPSTFAPSAHTHNYLPLSGGTLSNRLTIDYSATGGDVTWDKSGILIKNNNSSAAEAALAYQTTATGANYWITGINQGSVGSSVYSVAFGNAYTDALRKMWVTESGTIYSSANGNSSQWNTAYGWGNHAGLYLLANGKAADSNALDGIDSVRFVYGRNQSGSNTAPATWSSSDKSQYKSGFWEANGASWTPDTGWWWGITTAHTSNSESYNFGGQIIFKNNVSTPEIYFRSIGAGNPGSWSEIYHEKNKPTYSDVGAAAASHTHSYVPNNSSGFIRTGTASNQPEIIFNISNAASPQIGFTDHGDCSWAIGADDGDNSFKIHGAANATVPTINNLATPLFELTTTAGTAYLNGGKIWHSGNDGTGSGLDADMIDGLGSGSFWRRDSSNAYDVRFSSSHGRGVRFWDSSLYKIYMSSRDSEPYGVTELNTGADYNMYFRMTDSTRGFVFWNGSSSSTAAAQITGDGHIYARQNIIANSQLIANSGNTHDAIKTSGGIQCDTYISSSDTALVLGTNSSGTIYLRPYNKTSNSYASTFTTSQATIGTKMLVNGTITSTTEVEAYSSSDIRLKKRTRSFANVLQTVGGIDVFYHERLDKTNQIDIGVSAQRIEQLWNPFVRRGADITLNNGTVVRNALAVRYDKLGAAVAIQGLKETKQWMDSRDRRIAELEKEVKELKRKLAI